MSTETKLYENENRNRFFVTNWHVDHMTTIVSRSALDALDGVNEELCNKLNAFAEHMREGSDKMKADGFDEITCDEIATLIGYLLFDYGYTCIETRC